jgi:hypothetical protein
MLHPFAGVLLVMFGRRGAIRQVCGRRLLVARNPTCSARLDLHKVSATVQNKVNPESFGIIRLNRKLFVSMFNVP